MITPGNSCRDMTSSCKSTKRFSKKNIQFIMPDVEYGQEYTSLHSGDIAVMYTDGITEAMNLNREQFGLERLKKLVRENKNLLAKELTDKIYADIEEFVGGAPQHDDQTLLLMKAK